MLAARFDMAFNSNETDSMYWLVNCEYPSISRVRSVLLMSISSKSFSMMWESSSWLGKLYGKEQRCWSDVNPNDVLMTIFNAYHTNNIQRYIAEAKVYNTEQNLGNSVTDSLKGFKKLATCCHPHSNVELKNV